jgi:hypothetical protein
MGRLNKHVCMRTRFGADKAGCGEILMYIC